MHIDLYSYHDVCIFLEAGQVARLDSKPCARVKQHVAVAARPRPQHIVEKNKKSLICVPL